MGEGERGFAEKYYLCGTNKTIKIITMARAIRETPVLRGEDAVRFEKEMRRVERMSAEERKANRERARQAFENLVTEVQYEKA